MMKRPVAIVSIFLALFVFQAPVFANQSCLQIPEQITGELAWNHVKHLSEDEDMGQRVTGNPEELSAMDYIAGELLSMGYEVTIQSFEVIGWDGETTESSNVIATRPGKLDQTVIVGAHYDSIPDSEMWYCDDPNVPQQEMTGAGDNASGVGVMLEVAEVLINYEANRTIKFIAFGAEELGLLGSQYYVNQMSDDEIKKTVAMINLDSVGVGDFFYVYAGLDHNSGWARDHALRIGRKIGYDLRTSPKSEYYDYGTTGDWSDHVPFKEIGIPIAYFEWMNWDIEPDGGIETEEFGWIMHTCYDNLGFVSAEKLEMTADVVGALVFELSKAKLPKPKEAKVGKAKKKINIQKRNALSN